jgi:hypothetical protein
MIFRDLKLSPPFNLLPKLSLGPLKLPLAGRLAGLLVPFPLAANLLLLHLPRQRQRPLLLLPRAPRPRPVPLLLPRPRRLHLPRVLLLRRPHPLRVLQLRRQRRLRVRACLFKAPVRRLVLPSLFSKVCLDVRLLRRGIFFRTPEQGGLFKMGFGELLIWEGGF